MIKNNSSRIRIFCTLVFMTICSGCITGLADLLTDAENYVDLSDPTADKAQLRAAKWDIGIAGVYCYMTVPANAERVTVNAGAVNVSVVCETSSVGSNITAVDSASFSFNALAGHDYVITKRDCGGCVKLKDQTTKKLVAEYPILHSTAPGWAPVRPNVASIRAGEASRNKGGCRPFKRRSRESGDLINVDAGPVSINATCFRSESTARFEFVAEAGHTYTFTATEKDCISLLDITSEEILIACEPYSNRRTRRITTVSLNAALIEAGGASKDKGNCVPTRGGRWEERDFIEVDVGPIKFDAVCDPDRGRRKYAGRGWRVSSFDFVAEAGHIYTITATDKECMSLLDITSEEFVIACEPYRKKNPARIQASAGSRYNCMPTRGGLSERRDFIEVEAGPIKFDAICDRESFFDTGWRVSSFDFVAGAGHIYTITATDKECMSLEIVGYRNDLNSTRPIACEPYRIIE